MEPRELRPGVYSVGAVDWDRRIFDSLIPLPEGTSYNSYLVRGSEKTVLLDTVDPTMTEVLLDRLRGVDRIDYVVIQHVEQDHSGSLPVVLSRYPEAQVLCSARAVDLLATHLHVSGDVVRAVEDGEELALGGKTLRFIYTPWVHWPETMSTFLVEDQVLVQLRHVRLAPGHERPLRRRGGGVPGGQALLRRDHDAVRTHAQEEP